jgi:hypothetical protein
MIIIGAGMAGLLAANMLRHPDDVTVVEAAPDIPNNHSAVLRFRTPIVGDMLGIDFRKVRVMKAVQMWGNPVSAALAYSYKCNGFAELRSIASVDGQMVDRYIAPPNLISLMARNINIVTNRHVDNNALQDWKTAGIAVISTVPMGAAMSILRWPRDPPEFHYQHGVNVVCQLRQVDAYASVYVPDPAYLGSRISLTGDEMIIECPGADEDYLKDLEIIKSSVEAIAVEALTMLGLPASCLVSFAVKPQRYAKITAIDENIRKSFIMWASSNYNFYSLGRFATWRPGLLLDDVVHDVRVIQRIIKGDTTPRYEAIKG